MKQKTICFTGHRNLEHSEKEIKARLSTYIESFIKNDYTHFIVGGALGFDMLVAELLIELKNEFPRITLEIAIPCLDHTLRWNKSQKERYDNILQNADTKTLITQTYNIYSYQLRNKYMVNHSDIVIAYYNGKPSGTKNTICYTKKQGKEIFYI